MLNASQQKALENWVKLNTYLKDRKLKTTTDIENMLAYEVKNKKRINIIVRLNNKIFEAKRDARLRQLLRS